MLASNRLVTLLGMGGIGKSRLSLQLAAEVLDDFPDGVWFVELAALTDPRSVPQAVASVLGVKEEAGRPVIEALTEVRARSSGCWSCSTTANRSCMRCADLAKRLLQAGPGVKVLTSSRDYLQIAGETTYHVPTLCVPDPQAKESLSALAEHEAVRLFIDARDCGASGFRADRAERRSGRRHLPSAWTASRSRSSSRPRAHARCRSRTSLRGLNDRFQLLVTSDRTVLPRQRTLRALIDWSYDLLDERGARAVPAARSVRGRLDAGGALKQSVRAARSKPATSSTCSRSWSKSRWS